MGKGIQTSDDMTDDDFTANLSERIRQIEASQRLTEILTTQIFMRFAHATGDMSDFVKVVLDNMELDIRRAVGNANAGQKEAALDVADYFENLKGRMLAMIPKKAAVN